MFLRAMLFSFLGSLLYVYINDLTLVDVVLHLSVYDVSNKTHDI
jgi:hypothetical protein